MGKTNETCFGLIRHAKTFWNLEKRIQGQRDTELTDIGRQSARQWGAVLKSFAWDRILCSDLGRAMETARAINITLKVPITADAHLREQDWGRWTGLTVKTIESEFIADLQKPGNQGWRFAPPAGESRQEVWQRSARALLAAARKWHGETILVVTHNGVIRCLLYRLCDREFLPSESRLINDNHLHWLCSDHDRLRIEKINAMDLSC